ncbi:MAG: hypothetical protein AUJ57_07375 [Zetaproteobacteria bacterium CG1_02_53_45]|nr:MAG: hypothetical protein AUJ57_07375 [Zetaproteobacteria bacterium CG1_02_53_45]
MEQIYANADEWRASAMARADCVSQQEAEIRQNAAELHNRQNDVSDPDTLLDQKLYILGKMDITEYQRYLLFKHATPGADRLG